MTWDYCLSPKSGQAAATGQSWAAGSQKGPGSSAALPWWLLMKSPPGAPTLYRAYSDLSQHREQSHMTVLFSEPKERLSAIGCSVTQGTEAPSPCLLAGSGCWAGLDKGISQEGPRGAGAAPHLVHSSHVPQRPSLKSTCSPVGLLTARLRDPVLTSPSAHPRSSSTPWWASTQVGPAATQNWGRGALSPWGSLNSVSCGDGGRTPE